MNPRRLRCSSVRSSIPRRDRHEKKRGYILAPLLVLYTRARLYELAPMYADGMKLGAFPDVQVLGQRNRQDVAVQPLLGVSIQDWGCSALSYSAWSASPGRLHQKNPQVTVAPLRCLRQAGAITRDGDGDTPGYRYKSPFTRSRQDAPPCGGRTLSNCGSGSLPCLHHSQAWRRPS